MKQALPDGTRPPLPRAMIGVVSVALATTAMASPAAASAQISTSAVTSATAAAAPPPGTLSIRNRRTALTLEVGDVGGSGKGKVFSRPARGDNDVEQEWNFINRGNLVSRKLVRGQTVCMDTDNADRLFVARCVPGKLTQKWAFKLAVNAPGAFDDIFTIQNFATKKCVTSAQVNARGNAEVGAASCRTGNLFQQWTAAPFERG
ncbi:ricin-type beta-trefoil lectin domain protein [Nonomuraea lactucae]|uniref:ricin-type beta-trefoil lectin domain protein n=1 Tax=Nonomuraea lactucae TaxID=2249762 RepID=UPI0013B41692|nr:ricin-type beta-trefoil lectin domain protein [Nonomuraea lactucae]